MSTEEFSPIRRERRELMMRVLQFSANTSANEFVLQHMLASLGQPISLEDLRIELAWLANRSLIAINVAGGVHVATLTCRWW